MGPLDDFIINTLGLTKLPPYLPTLVYAFLGFSLVHLVIAPWASARWFPVAYASKGRRARNAWAIHVVSQVHAVLIVPLSLWVLWNESPAPDRAFGWDARAGHVYAVACGYFLWDAIDAVVNYTDAGFVLHGVACLALYIMSYKPFVAYYGPRCLLWETSTFFLNIHWFMDKTNRTGSTAQLVNGAFLLSSFFGVRLVYGGKMSFDFLRMLMHLRHELPLSYVVIYSAGNVLLTSLNWFWFYKMISALRRRFGNEEPKERRRLVGNDGNGHVDGNGSEGSARATGVANGYGTHA
ncbi:hypothetical protein H0H81_007175 [Sphagnurus paluster]|uniref:TLC domain-containing protein n=1 Tax=Sphagnurus paluster TaxID=117069 RepID=A0A9P7GTA9_9AGAR|nr:hypothetical protein H0H81_007175 [Sphagnurus paluster]